MIPAYELLVAMRYLRPRRQEGFLTVVSAFSILGIAVGVATLVVVLAVMNGFPSILLQRVMAVNGDLAVYGSARGFADAEALAGRLGGVAGIKTVHPVIEGNVLAYAAGGAAGVRVQGVRPVDFAAHRVIVDKIHAGGLEGFATGKEVVIGARLAERLGIGLGDRLRLVAQEGLATVFGTVPRQKTYRVGAVFDLGIFEYDDSYVFMARDAARVYFRPVRARRSLAVWLDDGADRAAARRAIVAAAEGAVEGVFDWRPYLVQRFDFVRVQRNAVILILSLIVVVAALNIVSGLSIAVTERTRDIGVLRTIGVTRGGIARIFVIVSLAIGLAGTALGIILGIAFTDNIETFRQTIGAITGVDLFSADIYSLSEIPAEIRAIDLSLVAGGTIALSFLATLVPSFRAARLDPVEALRGV